MSAAPVKETTLVGRARDGHRAFSLPVSDVVDLGIPKVNYLSPYFRLRDTDHRKVGTGRDTKISLATMKCLVYNLLPDECDYKVYDGISTAPILTDFVVPNVPVFSSLDDISSVAIPMIITKMAGLGYTISATDIVFPDDSVGYPYAAYQTIVTQTGTGAPAVSGGFTPMSMYATGTTFTWARSSAGVYTLTASAAVFNTGGKTAVFLGALNNLNGAWKAVVTSSTVITFTFAVQSLAVLGLLGFTATPTDALLTQTMIEVRTYA